MVLVHVFFAQVPFLFAQISDLEKEANGHFDKGKFDSAQHYYLLAKEDYFQSKNFEDYVKIGNYLNYLYYETYQIDSFKLNVLSTFAEAQEYLSPDHQQYLTAFSSVNSLYFNKCDYKRAGEVVQDLIRIKKKIKKKEPEFVVDYSNLGNAYSQMGDTKSAFYYFTLAQNILNKHQIDTLPELAYTVNQSIAHIYRKQKKYDEAKKLFGHGVEILKNSQYYILKHNSLIWMSEIEALTGNFDEAVSYLNRAKEILPNDPIAKVRRLESLELLHRNRGEYAMALEAINAAQNLAEEENSRMINSLQIERFIKMAEANFALGQIDEALFAIRKGIALFNPVGEKLLKYENPSIENFYNILDGFNLLSLKAKLLYAKYELSSESSDLEHSLSTGLLAIQLYESVRNNIPSEESRRELSGKSSILFQETFDICFKLFELSNDKKYAPLLFNIAENSKANLMLENFYNGLANQLTSIPDSIVNIERNIQSQISFLRKEIFQTNADINHLENKDTELNSKTEKDLKKSKLILENLNSDLAGLNSDHDLLVKDLEKKYPLYFQTKYNAQAIDLENLKIALETEKVEVIEYFEGMEHLYALLISADDIQIKRLCKKKEVQQLVTSLTEVLYDRSDSKSAKEEFQTFQNSAFGLYENILDPFVEHIRLKSLVIIPDGLLSLIPFESLLISESESMGYDLQNLHYVLEDYSISYESSASFFVLNSEKTLSSKNLNFVGFAPSFSDETSFSCNGVEIENLSCSIEEVNVLAQIWNGVEYLNAEATGVNMLDEIMKNDIVHLATHTCIDNSDFQNHEIYFSDQSLSSIEIENLELENEMVVLSACNTGTGKIFQGEGVFSLARGFLNSGCKSVLMSLWAVDDCSTNTLMQLFYKNLDEGIGKAEALRLAKIEYLSTAPKVGQHPSLWSPFVAYGNMRPVIRQTKFPNRIILFSIVSVLLFGIIYKMKTRKISPAE